MTFYFYFQLWYFRSLMDRNTTEEAIKKQFSVYGNE